MTKTIFILVSLFMLPYSLFKIRQTKGKKELNEMHTDFGGGSFFGGIKYEFLYFFWIIVFFISLIGVVGGLSGKAENLSDKNSTIENQQKSDTSDSSYTYTQESQLGQVHIGEVSDTKQADLEKIKEESFDKQKKDKDSREQTRMEQLGEERAQSEQAELQQFRREKEEREQAKLAEQRKEEALQVQAKLKEEKKKQAENEEAELHKLNTEKVRREQVELQQFRREKAEREQAKLAEQRKEEALQVQAKLKEEKNELERAEATLDSYSRQESKRNSNQKQHLKPFVCYDKKYINKKRELVYNGCIRSNISCENIEKYHFGRYPDDSKAHAAFNRCLGGSPKFVDSQGL